MATYKQFSKIGTFIRPVGNTQPVLEPGHYDVGADDQGLFFVNVPSRQDRLIEFADSASHAVLKAIRDFWAREAQFKRYELSYKRGIMLWGPPGSGKTCTMELVSRDIIEQGGLVFNYPGDAHPKIFQAAYRAVRDIMPEVPILVLMEDFEVLVARTNQSALLNMLDGVEQLHKIAFLASTNYPEKLDPRIINRPSRFDVRVEIAAPPAKLRAAYLKSLVKDDDQLDIPEYVRDTKGLSLAHVKELFVAVHVLGADYRATVRRLTQMDSFTPTSQETSFDDDMEEWEQELSEPVHDGPGQYL